jgi:hypothetical protein
MKAIARLSIFSALLLVLAPIALADGVVLYNTIPSTLPVNLPSAGYEASSISELGNLIQFAGGTSTYSLTSATIVMSDWAPQSDWAAEINGTTITSAGFYIPLTLNLYAVGSNNSVGALLDSVSIDAFIPWRPAATAGCGNNYLGSDGLCHGGSLSSVTFDLAGLNVPDTIIYGLAYNTEHYGSVPTGVPGPYVSLNFALSSDAPSVGSNPLPGDAYVNSLNSADYGAADAGNLGTFGQGTGWSPYSGAIEFSGQEQQSAVPEPSSLLTFATGLLCLAVLFMRRRRPALSRS